MEHLHQYVPLCRQSEDQAEAYSPIPLESKLDIKLRLPQYQKRSTRDCTRWSYKSPVWTNTADLKGAGAIYCVTVTQEEYLQRNPWTPCCTSTPVDLQGSLSRLNRPTCSRDWAITETPTGPNSRRIHSGTLSTLTGMCQYPYMAR